MAINKKVFQKLRPAGLLQASWPFLLAVLVFLGVKVAAGHGPFVEKYYSEHIYPVISAVFSFISGIIPFSVWDVFWILLVVLLLAGITLAAFKKIRFWKFVLRITQLAALLYSFFYISWGFNYFRPKIETRLEWKNIGTDEPQFRIILDTMIERANRNYVVIPSSGYREFDSLVENSYLQNSARLGINYPNGRRCPKTMLLSRLFSKLGVSGYFGPFFNEIHVNHYLLPMDYPFVLAHEKAHQFGITSEAEANFTAFVVCINSEDIHLRYSGYQSVLLYFLRNAFHLEDYHKYLDKLDKRVLNDLVSRQKYYTGLQNKRMSDVQTKINDMYLKANRIEKGIENYDLVVRLVLYWYRNQ